MAGKECVAIKDDFFSKPLSPSENVSLMGMRCRDCGEVFLGKVIACQNCQCGELSSLPLSREGILYSYTVVRNRPPGDYKGPDPFQPYPVGLVELPEGIRILSVLDCAIDTLAIGMPLCLSIHELYENDDGNAVLAYKFRPAKKEERL